MSSTTAALGTRVDKGLKEDFERTADRLGISPSSAISVFMTRFVHDGGFPFSVTMPTEQQERDYAARMDATYRDMLAGREVSHGLVEA